MYRGKLYRLSRYIVTLTPSGTLHLSMDATTIPEDDGSRSSHGDAPEALALVVVYCRGEAWRLGSVALLPATASGHFLLGRGEAPSASARTAEGELRTERIHRVSFVQQRPGGSVALPALSSPQLSREQLKLTVRGSEQLEVENLGRCPLWHNGTPVASLVQVRAGDLLQVGQQLLLWCARRPVRLASFSTSYQFGEFGEPDAVGIIGEAPAIHRLREQLAFAAARVEHVLVCGSSGTGKELVARALHALSARGSKPLVSRNAATIPDTLVDAELFGNAKNYPNSGMAERPGLVGEADGGTLFFDEIAELPLALQAHLLRVLDAGEYQRLGDTKVRTSSFRLVGATNRPPAALKHDVLARLKLRIETPDLGAHREDVPLVAHQLLRRMAERDAFVRERAFPSGDLRLAPAVSLELMATLVRHPYTAHVRELEALLWRAVTETRRGELKLHGHASLDAPTTSPASTSSVPLHCVPGPPSDADVAELTPGRIQAALDAHNGSFDKAFRALGLKNRFVLHRLIAKHGLEVRRRSAKR
ncbi:MAG: sigma 54-interacting transcriptional regulator [Myxococcales bacterium]